jgi:GNAT superfamily N-acetyltransferase
MDSDTPYASVRRVADADRRTVVDVLVEAFMADPVVCWLFPDPGERARLQARFYRPLLTHPAGEAYLAGRRDGASVWLTLAEGEAAFGAPPDADFGESGARLLALGEALGRRHPDHEPHLYLPCMGVIPGRQGSGLGSAMLRHRLSQVDIAAYLEASSPRSRELYLRHGFEDLGEPVSVADSPPLWPMWRRPDTTTTGREHP